MQIKKPVEIEGKKYTSMTFYFDRLTGEDIEAIEEELQAFTSLLLPFPFFFFLRFHFVHAVNPAEQFTDGRQK